MRLFYKTRNFTEGKIVTGFFINPDLQKSELQTFTELEGGLYYLDYDFIDDGPYCGKFFEDGIATTAQVFRNNKFPGLITYKK